MLDPKVGERWWARIDGMPAVVKVLAITDSGEYISSNRPFFDGYIVYEMQRSQFMCRYRGIARRLLDRIHELIWGSPE
jgi:hypothetical protein